MKDKEKVIFAVSYMRGRALNWINTDIIKYIDNDNPDSNIKEQMEDFGKFKKRIRMIFGPANKKALAESIIQTLRQTISASDYSTVFRYYTAKTDWNNDIQISIYKRGLKDNVQDKLIRYEIRARIDNLDDFIKVSIGLDDKLYQRNIEKREKGGFAVRQTWKELKGDRDAWGTTRGNLIQLNTLIPQARDKPKGGNPKEYQTYRKIRHIIRNYRSKNKV